MDTPDWSSALADLNDLLVLNTSITGNALGVNSAIDVPLVQYSSLLLVMNSAVNQILQLDFHQAGVVGAAGDTVEFTEYITSIDPTATTEAIFPAYAGSVRLTNRSSAAINLVGYGTTRRTERAMNLGDTCLARSLSYTGATTVAVPVKLLAIDGGLSTTSMNGQINVRAASGSIDGLFGYRYVTRLGTTQPVYLGSFVAGGSFFGTITQPLGHVEWIVRPGSTAASTTFSLDLTQV